MKSELSMRDFHCLETDRNWISDLTGSLFMISAWISNGISYDILILISNGSEFLGFAFFHTERAIDVCCVETRYE
ncbi:hypothetical protein Hanom_Chr17g01541341 [Helianthus anomalus]